MDVNENTFDKFLREDSNGLQLPLPEKLYHYTGSETVAPIKANLNCFNASTMEDPLEFRLGFCFLQHMRVRGGYPLNEVLSDPAAESVRCWTFSLCMEGADVKMGRKYACPKEGHPVILEFEYEQISDAVRELMRKDLKNDDSTAGDLRALHFLLPCLYSVSHLSEIEKVQDFLFEDYYEGLCAKLQHIGRLEIACACSYMFRAMIKGNDYKKEQEYRLVKITLDGSDEISIPYGFSKQI